MKYGAHGRPRADVRRRALDGERTYRSPSSFDEMWARLSEGGEEGQCGRLKDRYGVSWRIVPKVLAELMGDPDPQKASRVMHATLGMTKIDIQGLRDAYDGRS